MIMVTPQARECFKALDSAALRAPVPVSCGKVGDNESDMALFVDGR